MFEFNISFVAAFVGGLVSLLPACGPALVPAFFAYTFAGHPRDAVRATLAFALGFSLLFVPFSLGVKGIFDILSLKHSVMYTIAGSILLLVGAFQLMRVQLPVWYARTNNARPLSFVGLGMVFGLTSAACITPVLGGIATLVAAQGSWSRAVWLLLAFELGMFLPLLLLAWGARLLPFLKQLHRLQMTLAFGKTIYRIGILQLISSMLFILLGLGFLFPKFSNALLPESVRQYFINIAR